MDLMINSLLVPCKCIFQISWCYEYAGLSNQISMIFYSLMLNVNINELEYEMDWLGRKPSL